MQLNCMRTFPVKRLTGDKIMIQKDLEKKKDQLEKENAALRKEIEEIDTLMRLVGFDEGIETLKAAAEALLVMNKEQEEEEQDRFDKAA